MNVERQFTKIGLVLVFNFLLSSVFTAIVQTNYTGKNLTFIRQLTRVLTQTNYNVTTITGVIWLAVLLTLVTLAYNNVVATIIADFFLLAGFMEYLSSTSINGVLFLPKSYLSVNYHTLFQSNTTTIITGTSGITMGIGVVLGAIYLAFAHSYLARLTQYRHIVKLTHPIFTYDESVTRATFSLALVLAVLYPYLSQIIDYIQSITK